MPNCKWLTIVPILIASLCASSTGSARADDECLAKPTAPPPRGLHWYYRFDRTLKRQCWYLREEGLPVRKPAPQADTQPAPQPAAPPQSETAAQPQPETAATAAPSPDNNFSAEGEPVPWLDVTNLRIVAPAARPVPPPAPGASQIASAGEDPLPASERVADGARKFPPPENKQVATGEIGDPPPARDNTSQPHADAPAPIEAAAEIPHVFSFFMLLFAGLAIGGPLLHYYAKRRRTFEAAGFGPPPWARVIALNAPIPRVRVRWPAARQDALGRSPVAPPLVPADHSERLAETLQRLADQLRTQQVPEPGAARRPARRTPSRHEDAQERRAGRAMPADAFGIPGKAAARARHTVRSSS